MAFEALARGPKGSRFASAPALLAEAYRTGRVTEFDWVARASACRAAMAAGLSVDIPLFVNIEPLALDTECPADLREDIDTAYRLLHIVLPGTEYPDAVRRGRGPATQPRHRPAAHPAHPAAAVSQRHTRRPPGGFCRGSQ